MERVADAGLADRSGGGRWTFPWHASSEVSDTPFHLAVFSFFFGFSVRLIKNILYIIIIIINSRQAVCQSNAKSIEGADAPRLGWDGQRRPEGAEADHWADCGSQRSPGDHRCRLLNHVGFFANHGHA